MSAPEDISTKRGFDLQPDPFDFDRVSLRPGVRSEYSVSFLQGMIDRMAVSFHKYGPVAKARGFDNVANLKKRLKLYRKTGNTEWLIDVANFAMIEFMAPQHESAHFRATSSDESPGRQTADGRTTRGSNAPAFHGHEGD